jgi:hypothetical protein
MQLAATRQMDWKVPCKFATGFRRLPKVPCRFAARFRQLPKVSCKFAARFPKVGKSPASLQQGFQRLESLLQVCNKVSKFYEGFVNELNQRIEKYNRILARREGRNAKKEE